MRMRRVIKLFSMATTIIVVIVSTSVLASSQIQWDFEQESSRNNGISGWFFTGNAGLDNGNNFAHRGLGNAWVRNTTGWNAVNNWVDVSAPPGSECTASAWLRTADTLSDGYMSVRDGDRPDGSGTILNEMKLVGARPSGNENINGYHLESFNFRMGSFGRVFFYVGLWGVGEDAWIQIDDASITCRTPPNSSNSGSSQASPSELELRPMRTAFFNATGISSQSTLTSSSTISFIGYATHGGVSDVWLCTASQNQIENNHPGNWRRVDSLALVLRGGDDAVWVVSGRVEIRYLSRTCKPDDDNWYRAEIPAIRVVGGSGNDVIIGPRGGRPGGWPIFCSVESGSGNDYIESSCFNSSNKDASFIAAGDGNDTLIITTDEARENIFAGSGDDQIVARGTSYANPVDCGPGTDALFLPGTLARGHMNCENFLGQEPSLDSYCRQYGGNNPLCFWHSRRAIEEFIR